MPASLAHSGPIALLVGLGLLWASSSAASNRLDLPADEGRNPRITGVWYIAYVHEDVHSRPDEPERPQDFSRFEIQRGYLTYRTGITPRLAMRITSDISVDQEGDGLGDIELRLKYGYVEFSTGAFGPVRDGRLRAGVLQTPWISFEQEINDYRVQGPMFLNRSRIFSSADYGAGFFCDLGDPLDEAYRERVDRRHSGRWGSIAIGLYNGGGYDEIEENESLIFQARLTLRPLPGVVPGLQVTAGFADGEGNTVQAPDYRAFAFMLSHESTRTVLTFTGYDGVGDVLGSVLDDDDEPFDQLGASVFGELRLAGDLSAIGRFEVFRWERPEGDRDLERWIGGIAWRCIPGGQLLLDYERQQILGGPTTRRNDQAKLALEVRF